MVKENELPIKSDIDLGDFLRVVSEEGVSNVTVLAKIKELIESGTATPYLTVVGTGDDKGLICTEQFSVGSPCIQKESAFGGGDSYPIGGECSTPEGPFEPGSAWHCTLSNTTGQIITGAVDVTQELASDTGSTKALFNGTTAGNYILFGSDHVFPGIKAKIETAGVVEQGHIQGEFLPVDFGSWIAAAHMVTQAEYPYEQRANIISAIGGESEQWHFGFNPLLSRTSWQKTTMTINGTDYTKYWGRLRILTNITTDPVIQQIKLHTDRLEINADGTVEHYGLSVYPKTLVSGVNNLINNTIGSPSNQDVNYESGQTIADYTDNQFNNGAIDSAIIIQNILDGIHTGISLIFSISYYPEGNETGDVEWEAHVYEIADGFVYDGSASPEIYTEIDTIATPSEAIRRTANILIPIDNLTYNDSILIKLRRDATIGNADDTLPENCVVTNVRLTGYFWRP